MATRSRGTFLAALFLLLPVLVPSHLAAQANDLCVNAIGPLAVPSTTAGTTVGAGVDSEAPVCDTFSVTAPGVWYTVVGTGNTMTASQCNPATEYDGKVSVYCTGCNNFQCVGGNDDACGFVQGGEVSWCSQAGVAYHVLVHGFGGASGLFELDLSDDGQLCEATVQCVPTGACSLCGSVPPTCIVGTEAYCEAQGGIYIGDDTECLWSQTGSQSFSDSPALAIPDGRPGVTTEIVVPDASSCAITDVNVELQVAGTWISDLQISVTSPQGSTVPLWLNDCAGTVNLNATADDEGTETQCAVVAAGPSNAVFYNPVVGVGGAPPPGLTAIEGELSGGTWTLSLQDTVVGDDHTLNFWAVHITCGTPVVDVCTPAPVPAPTLSTWGIAAAIATLLALALLALRRRSRV